jgi:hypothetical protein
MQQLGQFDLLGYQEPPEPPARRRSRRTNNPLNNHNQLRKAGRRIADLYRSLMSEMADKSTLAQANALRAAELMFATEEARAQLIQGKLDPDAVVRLEHTAHRAYQKLGLDRQRAARRPKLQDYIVRAADPPSAAAPANASAPEPAAATAPAASPLQQYLASKASSS